MAEYISREAVFQVVHGIARRIADRDIEALKAKDVKAFYKAKGAKEILDSVDTDLCYIPTADVQPVKHGQWIWDSNAPYRDYGAYKCSNCGSHIDFEENYCYNCGARMDGGAENETD